MKIHGGGESSGINSLIQRIQQGHVTGSERYHIRGKEEQQGEKVEISPQAKEIQRLKAILDQIPDVREKRVQQIKELIQAGNYKVDLDALTDKILEGLIIGDL